MWQKKTVYTLNIGGNFANELTELTLPWIKHWCNKIGAEFIEITERKFPEFPITYEKHRVFELSKQRKDDWSIFVDSDTLIHSDFFDITNFIPVDHCAHNGSDPAYLRWKYTREMIRDGRNIGSCSWFCIASYLTINLFEPPPDLTPEQIKNSIFPIRGEVITGLIPPERLCEDFTMSHNIAKYGLRFKRVNDILIELGYKEPQFLVHFYNIPLEEKIVRMQEVMKAWGLM